MFKLKSLFYILLIFLINLNAVTFTAQEKEWIKNNPIVKVGSDNNWPPFDYEDEKGFPRGIATNYLNLISKHSGLEFQIENDYWPNIISKIKEDKIDMISSLYKTKQRQEFLSFVPFLTLDSVAVAKKTTKISSLDDIKNLKIANVKNAAMTELLKSIYPNIEIVYAKTNEEAIKFVSYGKADVYLDTVPFINYVIEKNILSNLEIKFSTSFEPIRLSFGIKKDKDVLHSIIDKSFRMITEEEKNQIKKLYSYKDFRKNELFTKEQLLWIKENPIIKVGVDANWPPFDFVDSTGNHQGISSEYLQLISKYTGLEFDYYPGSWEDVIGKIRNKEVDILACAAITPDRQKYLKFSNAYLDVDVAVVGRKDLKIDSFEELSKYTIAVQKDNYIYERLKKRFPKIKFYFVNSNEDAFKAITYGEKADLYLGNLAVITYFIEKNLLTNLEIKFKADFNTAKLSIAVLKEKKILYEIIEKVLKNLKADEKTIINKKWAFENDIKHTLLYTNKEKNWLNKNPVIKIVGDPSWPPFSFFKDGKYSGMIPEIVALVEEISGLNFEYVNTKNWTDSLKLFNKQEVVLIDAITTSSKRKQNIDFTSKYLTSHIVIVSNKENSSYVSSIKSIPNAKDIRLGIVKGYPILEKVKKDNIHIKNFVMFNTIEEGLKALSSKGIDYFIVDIPSLEYFTKKYNLSNLNIVGPTGYQNNYSFGIVKGNEELVSILNKVLKYIPQNKMDEIYRKWIKVEYEEKIDYSLIWKIIVVALLILGGTFYWNRKLQEEIVEKEKAQKELEKEKVHVEELNEKLQNSKEKAENLAKQKSEFLANMSHEIRTPMNSVIGFTEILDKELTNPIQKEYLHSIKKGGDSLLRIINDILDLSKIEAGKLEIKNESINPKSLFLEIEAIFHSKIVSKNISFQIDIDKTIPKYVIVDGVRLRQILFNIIGNAIKFTEKGYIKVKVDNVYKDEIRSKVDLIFSIEDTGIGIEEKSLKTIFNSFEQQENHNVAKYGGTGLGLAICSKLVYMMNGDISVESKRNVGSKFVVKLKDLPVSSIEKDEEIKALDCSNIIFKKAKILVVDDIEENRKLVDAALKDYKIELIMAQNGKEALEILKNINVDLILMDLRMPIMNGYEAVTSIKNDEKMKNIPVVALTASVMGKDLEKVKNYGFDGYLRKPVIIEDLIVELGKFLQYEFVENKMDIITKEDKILDKNKLKNTIRLLEKEFKIEWEKIKDSGDFSTIEEFAKKLETIGKENEINIIINYSQELLKNIEAFDIEKVDYLMNTFMDIIESLKGKM